MESPFLVFEQHGMGVKETSFDNFDSTTSSWFMQEIYPKLQEGKAIVRFTTPSGAQHFVNNHNTPGISVQYVWHFSLFVFLRAYFFARLQVMRTSLCVSFLWNFTFFCSCSTILIDLLYLIRLWSSFSLSERLAEQLTVVKLEAINEHMEHQNNSVGFANHFMRDCILGAKFNWLFHDVLFMYGVQITCIYECIPSPELVIKSH